MSTDLVLRFPLSRYHATPWGRNVNEGVVEWPPSPWRLLRALYATWRNRCPDLDGEVVLGLLDSLATAPTYLVPPYATAHTRHYMPGSAHKEGVSSDRTKVIDGFVSVAEEPGLVVRWPVDLSEPQVQALRTLAGNLTYLGRADSVCEAEVRTGTSVVPEGASVCSPIPDGSEMAGGIDLLVPDRPLSEADLTVSTATLRGVLRRREPPGSHQVRYPQPPPGGEVRDRSRASTDQPTTVRWSLVARPARAATVAWTDTLRLAALSRYGGPTKRPAPDVLSGRSDGTKRTDRHLHVHWFAFGDPDDRRLSTLVAWAPEGFDDEVLDALTTIQRLRRPGISDVRPSVLGLEGWGTASDVVPELVPRRPCSAWESITPFAPARYPKKSVPFDEHVVSSIGDELRWRGLPEASVELMRTPSDDALGPSWLAFRTHRPSGERLAQARRAVGVRLQFGSPQTGPMALGALSHFGLGLFRPVIS